MSAFEPPRYDVLDHLSSRLAGGGATLIRTIEAVTHANEEANRGHVVHAFKTPVLLLRADRRAKWSGMRYDDPTNGWARYARGGLSIIGFDYDHRELVDEPGPAVGLALQTAIDAARDATRELGPGLDGWPGIAGQCANATTSWSERNTISSTELPAS